MPQLPRSPILTYTAGFTLVELLIVVAVIAILAAIGLPQYQAYMQKAVRGGMVSDAKNAATNEEAFFSENKVYSAVAPATGPASITIGSATVGISKGNTLSITVTPTTFTVTVANSDAGSGMSPLTFTNAGVCTWSDGTSC